MQAQLSILSIFIYLFILVLCFVLLSETGLLCVTALVVQTACLRPPPPRPALKVCATYQCAENCGETLKLLKLKANTTEEILRTGKDREKTHKGF